MIKKVGSTVILERHKATCHCGAVEMELSLPNGSVNPRRCDRSIGRRKGAIVASVELAGVRMLKGQDMLKPCQFNTWTAQHHFCSNCVVHTHHQRSSSPTEYGYNVGCLDGVNPFDLEPVPTNDGVNHPAERIAH